MPATKTSLQGGGFQDSEGGTLANGYLIFELSQDATVPRRRKRCRGHRYHYSVGWQRECTQRNQPRTASLGK